MHALTPLCPAPRPAVAPLSRGILGRTALALAALTALVFFTLPLMAREEVMRLRGDVTARGDVITLGELVEGAPATLAARPLFRAPALGAIGTIQAQRILDAAAQLGLGEIETGGRIQVTVQRAARRVGAPEIEAALKRALETTYHLDPRGLSVRLDGESPVLLAPVALDGQASAVDVTYDPRSRRIAGLIVLGDGQASLRVGGQTIETREIAVLTRALNRGEMVGPNDVVIERRPREGLPIDVQGSVAGLAGQIAQRGLNAGSALRSGDVAPPDLITRGEAVTIVFETPGVALSLRGVASESGRLGAIVSVVNPVSKKVLAATVVGPGRVSVGPSPAPIVQASASPVP